MAEETKKTGACLCGEVRFSLTPHEPNYNICHCSMCRKWSAGPFMSVHCAGDLTFEKDAGLSWYQGSEWAQRGFCTKCGTSLFWRLAENPEIMTCVSVEALDDAEAFKLNRHIYADAQPQRYDFADDCPRVTEAELLEELGITDS